MIFCIYFRFGNTTLQDRTNEESLGKFYKYIEQYEDMADFPGKIIHSALFLSVLTFITIWANSADNILVTFFSYFFQKTGFDTSCKLSPDTSCKLSP